MMTQQSERSPEVSAAQLAANQSNAQKSTGPKTEEGKAKARYNARRHGLTGQFYCMSAQDEDAYQSFEANMLKDLKPVGAYENQIAISIVQDHWRLNRSRATEFNLYGRGHDERADLVDAPTENTHAAAIQADTCRDDHRVFANIALYETRIHRLIAKNEKRLEELQTERKSLENKALQEAELLVQFADFTGESPEDVGLILTNEGENVLVIREAVTGGLVPTSGLHGSQSLADGFVFSIHQIRYKLAREQRLADARKCAQYRWDPAEPALRVFKRSPKAA